MGCAIVQVIDQRSATCQQEIEEVQRGGKKTV